MTLPVASVALRARASLCAMFVCELVVLSVSAVVGSSEPPKNEAKEIRLVSRSSLVRSALTRRRRRRSGSQRDPEAAGAAAAVLRRAVPLALPTADEIRAAARQAARAARGERQGPARSV